MLPGLPLPRHRHPAPQGQIAGLLRRGERGGRSPSPRELSRPRSCWGTVGLSRRSTAGVGHSRMDGWPARCAFFFPGFLLTAPDDDQRMNETRPQPPQPTDPQWKRLCGGEDERGRDRNGRRARHGARTEHKQAAGTGRDYK
jgi:hypothetical protein